MGSSIGYHFGEAVVNQSELMMAIEPEIARINDTMRADLANIGSPLLAEMFGYAVLNSGKRIRPVLTVLSARLTAFPEPPPENIYQLAITFEYLHTASLLHDDVIDHADQRRGHASANFLWGNSPVILAGDYLLARAMLLAGTVADAQCLGLIGQALTRMTEAEFLQMETVRTSDRREENYFAILDGKTGALIAAACEAGALVAGASPRQQSAIRTYGNNLGLAFQLVDDILDYLGDPHQTGKTTGNDLHEGKMTLPLIYVLQQGRSEDRLYLEQLLKLKKDDRSAQLERVRAIIESNGGFAYTRKKASQLLATAVAELENFPQGQPRSTLAGLADYVLNRNK
jgi:octaprenyl-diphosphate synthase